MFKYLKSLIRANSLDSSKSFSLVVSCLIGGVMGLVVAFCLVWDTIKNTKITTDLNSLGIFLLCVGGYMAGGGITKTFAESSRCKNLSKDIENQNSCTSD